MHTRKLILLSALLASLVLVAVATAQGPEPQAAQGTPLGTGFTYQGLLRQNNTGVTGSCDFQFGLFDALSNGSQLGVYQPVPNLPVTNGVFTALVNGGNEFGAGAFAGDARWLEVLVRCPAGIGSFQALAPRQALAPAPLARYSTSTGSLLGRALSTIIPAPNQVLKWNGVQWAPAADEIGGPGSGDISAVYAGTGLSGGGTLGDVTLSADTTYLQRRVLGSCASGNAIRVVNADGTASCQPLWSMQGNSGTSSSLNFIGTTDNVSLTFRVNNATALRLLPGTSPSILGGHTNNAVTFGAVGAAIAGGGYSDGPNKVTDDYGTVGGGANNQAGDGLIDAFWASYATVGGGKDNVASGQYSTIGGGAGNHASGALSTIGGGSGNGASGGSSTVGGGQSNSARWWAVVGGGESNEANGDFSTVAGGRQNHAYGTYATVAGGYRNTAAGDYSFAAGRQANVTGDGAFTFADSRPFTFTTSTANSFRVRATSGVRFVVGIDENNNGSMTWSCLLTDGNSWSCSSDRNLKENFRTADGRALLRQLDELPILYWNGKGQDPQTVHLGPMAQDFYAAFGLGADDKSISTIDLDGVALAAIQGLHQIVQQQDARLAEQQQQIGDLQARLGALERTPLASNAAPSGFSPEWLAIGALILANIVLMALHLRRGGQA